MNVISRRRVLKRGAAIGVTMWSAPAIVKISRATAQASPIGADPCGVPCGSPLCGENLVTNPGAEDSLTGWSQAGGLLDFRSVEYGGFSDFIPGAPLAGAGERYFAPERFEGNGVAQLRQTIDISSLTDLFACRCIKVGFSFFAGASTDFDGTSDVEVGWDGTDPGFHLLSVSRPAGWGAVSHAASSSRCIGPGATELVVTMRVERTDTEENTAIDNVVVALTDFGPLP